MPTHDTSTGAQLRALTRLQHIDSRIDQIHKLRGDLPEEIRDLEDEKAGLQTRIQNIEEDQEETAELRRKADRDIKEAEQLIKKYEEQQTQVRNNREYDALTKEIEAQKQRIADAEAQLEATEHSAEQFERDVAEAQERLQELDDLIDEKSGDLENVLEETRQEEDALKEQREEAREQVDKRYLRAYDRLRNRLRDGRAVVQLERGAAAGFAVPPQRQVEIRQRNRVIACEHTGRIIVDSELYDETADELGFETTHASAI